MRGLTTSLEIFLLPWWEKARMRGKIRELAENYPLNLT
jgi:hypothetical protein